jgi:M-phase inducer tyrosine phosphatase
MQVSFAASSTNPHSHPQLPVSALSIKALQDNIEDQLPSDLEISFASSMSLNLVDNVGREDIVPMDISPEPSRIIHQSRISSGHLLEKVTRTRAFTTSVRLFGRDLGNGMSTSPVASSCESGPTIASHVRVVSNQARPHTISHKVDPIIL